MPNITIEWAEGRTVEQKREIVEQITELMVRTAKAKPESVRVAIFDIPLENTARGGKLKLDTDTKK